MKTGFQEVLESLVYFFIRNAVNIRKQQKNIFLINLSAFWYYMYHVWYVVIYEILLKLKIKIQSKKLAPNLVMLEQIPSSTKKTHWF